MNMKGSNTFSGFDGIGSGMIGIKKTGITPNLYFASEIDEKPIRIAMHNYPDIIQLSDITKVKIKTIWLSETYDYLCKNYFNENIKKLQGIIPKRELLYRINKNENFSAYFGTQSNNNLSINDRIWFWKNPIGNFKGMYDIIRSGDRKQVPNTLNVGELCKHSFWWNGQNKPSIEDVLRRSFESASETPTIYKKTQATVVECEWGLIIFKGKINVILGGSPCQSFSSAGSREGFDGKSGLFFEWIRIKNETQPDYFLLENVVMKKQWENVITSILKVNPHYINSSVVSAQSRPRLYWTNIPYTPIEDRNIKLGSVVHNGNCGAGKHGKLIPEHLRTPGGNKWKNNGWEFNKENKSYCLTTTRGVYQNNQGEVMKYTPEEAEALQTVPKGYTKVNGVSNTDRHKSLGNGWTIDVLVEAFFKNLPWITKHKTESKMVEFV